MIVAIIAIVAAIVAVCWMHKVNKSMEQMLEYETITTETGAEEGITIEEEEQAVDLLQDDFDQLLWDESVGELYEGETGFGFIQEE